MFSGIVETTSPVLKIVNASGERRMWIRRPAGWKLRPGGSVCVEGVCSTVQAQNRRTFQVIYMPETLRRTTLGDIQASDRVNLERCLSLGSIIGGHLVQGHIDCAARIVKVTEEAGAKIYEFSLPRRFSRYVVEKGSIAVDGISLTVMKALPTGFGVSLLAYTLSHTTLGSKTPGRRVNVEVDLIAKYVEKLLPA